MKIKLLCIGFLFVVFGCAHTVTLEPDESWHVVWSLNRPYETKNLDIVKKSKCSGDSKESKTAIRMIRLTSFIDLTKLPDSKEDTEKFYSTTEHSGVPIRTLDSGVLDIVQDGTTYQLKLTKGMALISRTNEKCSYLVIKEIAQKESGNE